MDGQSVEDSRKLGWSNIERVFGEGVQPVQ